MSESKPIPESNRDDYSNVGHEELAEDIRIASIAHAEGMKITMPAENVLRYCATIHRLRDFIFDVRDDNATEEQFEALWVAGHWWMDDVREAAAEVDGDGPILVVRNADE